jgi:hypothetical protein
MNPAPGLIVDLTTATVVCHRAIIADRPWRRLRGLLGRKSLPEGEGLLLRPAPSIHTGFMQFPIDAVFVDRDMKVVKVVERLRPWRVASAQRARAVLELAAGEAARRGIEVGHLIGVVDSSEPAAARWGVRDVGPRIDEPSAELGAPGPAGAHALDTDATRVLLVGADRRFRSLAAALLTRRGCAVSVGEPSASVAELAERERAEVVVIDAGGSLTDAARDTAQIRLLDRPVGVVVVGDATEGLSTLPVLSKWGSFDSLCGAIEHARPVRGNGYHGGT